MGKRLLWTTPGLAVGTALMFVIRYGFQHRSVTFFDFQLPLWCGLVSVWLAERKGRVPTAEEASRPITLFGDRSARK